MVIAIHVHGQKKPNTSTRESPMKDNDEFAFPLQEDEYLGDLHHGMTLRDYIAAKCVASMVSTISSGDDYERVKKAAEYHNMDRVSDWFAYESYKQADAMLRARKKVS